MTTDRGGRNDTAERLLDAVDKVIAEHGPSGVTLRRVGAQAGLSHTAAAHYFSDKPGLMTAYVTRAWNGVADGIEQAATVVDERAALLGAAEAYATFAVEHRSAFAVMGRLEFTNVDTPELWSARERGFFALTAIIVRAQEQGWATGRETLDIIATGWGFVQGFVDLWVGGPLRDPYDGNELVPTLRRLLDDLLDALDRPPS